MRFLHRHKNKKGLHLDDPSSSAYEHGRHGALNLPSADERRFLHHASEEAREAWNNIHSPAAHVACPPPTRRSAQLIAALPSAVLERIFKFVCPHTTDESYETCENSADEGGCTLCDLRDLAHCTMVCKRWRHSGVRVLYHGIRIDPVHYCDREIYLSEHRKHRNRLDRNGIPEDAPKVRLELLARTLREDAAHLARFVRFLKIPYMVREANPADMARTIHVLPGLKYVDLPEGIFSDERAYATLRLEVQARCPDLRKMTYHGGSENSFALLAQGNIWSNIEVLELKKMNVDPVVMRQVLGVLGNLRALKVTETRAFTDEVFVRTPMLAPFPPLEEFILTDVPGVTSAGLVEYLADPDVADSLDVLSLTNTGVEPARLREVLDAAPALRTLTVTATVASAISPAASAFTLASRSLETLRFEISAEASAGPFSQAASSHYAYLANSILLGGLPRLQAVYVLDSTFSDSLLGLAAPPPFGHRASLSVGSTGSHQSVSAPPPGFGGMPGTHPRPISSFHPAGPPNFGNNNKTNNKNPFAKGAALLHTLEIFSKDAGASDWNLFKVPPASHHHRGNSHGRGHGGRGLAPSVSPRMPVTAGGAFDGGPLSPAPPAAGGRSQRPVSAYGLRADVSGRGWEHGAARHSIIVGSGAGGFLAVPGQGQEPPMPTGRRSSAASVGEGGSGAEEWPRPRSSAGDKANMDLWR